MSFMPGLLPAAPANMPGLPPHTHCSMLTENVMMLAGNPTPAPHIFCSMAMLASMRVRWIAGHRPRGNDTLMPRLHTPFPTAMFAWRDARNDVRDGGHWHRILMSLIPMQLPVPEQMREHAGWG